MMRTHREVITAHVQARKSRCSDLRNVCFTIDGIRYLMTPTEALNLADRLVDAAEEVTND